MNKQNEVVIAFPAGGVSRTLVVVGGMTTFLKYQLDRTHFNIQFVPLTGCRKKKQWYSDVKMMVFGRSWPGWWLGRRDLTRGLEQARLGGRS